MFEGVDLVFILFTTEWVTNLHAWFVYMDVGGVKVNALEVGSPTFTVLSGLLPSAHVVSDAKQGDETIISIGWL